MCPIVPPGRALFLTRIVTLQLQFRRRGASPQGWRAEEIVFKTKRWTAGLIYVVGIIPNTSVWMPGMAPLPPKKRSGQGRPSNPSATPSTGRNSVKALALGLPAKTWRTMGPLRRASILMWHLRGEPRRRVEAVGPLWLSN